VSADPEDEEAPTGADAQPGAAGAASPAARLLRAPRDGTPPALVDPAELRAAIAALAAGTGPIAADAERASGYRYSQRAYLVQLRRAGAGTFLFDPIALPDLSELGAALADVEWVLHAANQDLPCLAELGLVPQRLFDTELAGRLLGSERVALSTMLERYLGITLEKGHSAADWSTRPLPTGWLDYAALDVELLVELRDAVAGELAAAGKTEWARQEFGYVLSQPPPPPRAEPWRRLSSIHSLRSRRQLAIARSLWTARDRLAAERDIAPGRVLPDHAVILAAKTSPTSESQLVGLPTFAGPRQRRLSHYWWQAVAEGRALPEAELPTTTQLSLDPDAAPPPSRWREREPAAALRLAAVKAAVNEAAAAEQVLAQNLLSADIVRRLAWRNVAPEPAAVADRLAEFGARPWQVSLLAARVALRLVACPDDPAAASAPPATTPAAPATAADPVPDAHADPVPDAHAVDEGRSTPSG
jgi:ribonuclease D